MEAFATVAELESGWRTLTTDENRRAKELLERASVHLSSLMEEHGIDQESKKDALRIVCCDMVQRKMESASASAVSAVTQQAGAFAQTTSYARPYSKGWKLWPEELAMLGIRKRRARSIRVAMHDEKGDEIEW